MSPREVPPSPRSALLPTSSAQIWVDRTLAIPLLGRRSSRGLTFVQALSADAERCRFHVGGLKVTRFPRLT